MEASEFLRDNLTNLELNAGTDLLEIAEGRIDQATMELEKKFAQAHQKAEESTEAKIARVSNVPYDRIDAVESKAASVETQCTNLSVNVGQRMAAQQADLDNLTARGNTLSGVEQAEKPHRLSRREVQRP